MWSPSRAAKERIAKRRSGTGASINMWPFVGVLLVLLVFFMTIGPPAHYHPWGFVNLPLSVYAASQPKAIREDAIRIIVSRDGSIFFRNAKVAPEELTERIREAVREGAERKVYLAVDGRSKYYDVEAVLDQIRDSGITQICVLAEKRRTQ